MGKNDSRFRTAYRTFYEQHGSADELLATADRVCCARVPVHGALFGLSVGSKELLEILQTGHRALRGFMAAGHDPLRIELPPGEGVDLTHKGPASGFILTNPGDDGVACILGLAPDLEYLWNEVRRYLRSWISPLYLRTQEFRRSLLSLSGDARVKGFTANVLWDDGQKVKTRREWFPVAKPVQEFFVELQQERQWLRSIEFAVQEEDSRGTGRIRRDLSFSCDGGFAVYWRTALAGIRRTAAVSRGVFQERGVACSPTHAARPLQIAYSTPVFDDKKQNYRLIKVLRGLTDSSLSVFHPNPFLHAAFMDYSDGSTYTIWVTDSSAIKIIPGIKASSRSLGKLCNHINEHFEEGCIEEIAL